MVDKYSYSGDIKILEPEVFHYFYSDKKILQEKKINKICEYTQKIKNNINWLNIVGLQNIELLSEIQEKFKLDDETIIEILDTKKQSRIVFEGDYIFIEFKTILYDGLNISYEQISLVLGQNYLLSFFENKSDTLDNLIREIKTSKKNYSIEDIFFMILNSFINEYFVILDEINNNMEDIEQSILSKPKKTSIQLIHKLKDNIILMRKYIWPIRDTIFKIREINLDRFSIHSKDKINFTYNDIIYIIESIDISKDMINNIFELYLSTTNTKLNEIMKVLTIISTIFIPLTYLTGMYGMNFKFIPLADDPLGFYINVGIMAVIGIIMGIVFKLKGWF